MNNEKVKATAKKASAKADEVTDSLLTRAIASPHTWAIMLCVFVLGVAVGKFAL